MYNRTPWIDTNLVITIYLTLNLPFSIPPPNKKTMERENKAGSFAAWHCKHRPWRLSLFSKWLSASNSCGPPNETTFRCQWWNQTTFAHISPTRCPCHGQHLRSLIGRKLQWWPWQCLLLYVRLPPSRQRTAAGPLAPSEPPDKSRGGPTEPPNQQNNSHTTKGAQPWVRTKPHHTAAVDTCTPDREKAEARKTPICHRSWGSIAMNGGPNGFLNKRQPSMSLMNLHHALTMENPAETRRQHLARLRRNIMVRRSLRTLPHNMVPSAKTWTTFPNTIRSRIIFATAPKCSRRKRSARAHRPRFRARRRKLPRLFPINAMKILTGKAINIVIPPIGSNMLTKTPSAPDDLGSVYFCTCGCPQADSARRQGHSHQASHPTRVEGAQPNHRTNKTTATQPKEPSHGWGRNPITQPRLIHALQTGKKLRQEKHQYATDHEEVLPWTVVQMVFWTNVNQACRLWTSTMLWPWRTQPKREDNISPGLGGISWSGGRLGHSHTIWSQVPRHEQPSQTKRMPS